MQIKAARQLLDLVLRHNQAGASAGSRSATRSYDATRQATHDVHVDPPALRLHQHARGHPPSSRRTASFHGKDGEIEVDGHVARAQCRAVRPIDGSVVRPPLCSDWARRLLLLQAEERRDAGALGTRECARWGLRSDIRDEAHPLGVQAWKSSRYSRRMSYVHVRNFYRY